MFKCWTAPCSPLYVRTAERLYASAVKILANVKTRVESMQIADVDQNPELFDQGTGTGGSTLLQPLSQTPLLDHLEHILARRTKYSIKLIRLFRRVTGKYPQRSISQRDHHSSSQNVLSRIPFIRYLDRFSSSFNLYTIRGRQSSKDAISSKTKAAVETAVQRLEKAFQLGKPDAGMVLADLHLVSAAVALSADCWALSPVDALIGLTRQPLSSHSTVEQVFASAGPQTCASLLFVSGGPDRRSLRSVHARLPALYKLRPRPSRVNKERRRGGPG